MSPVSPALYAAVRRLAPATMGIAILSLSVHVVMLQLLHVPYPDMAGVGRAGLVLVVLRMAALAIVYLLSFPILGRLSPAWRIVAVALIDTAVAGNVRTAVMDAVVTTDAAYPAIRLAAKLAESLVLGGLIVASRRIVRGPASLIGIALVLTAIMIVLVAPAGQAIIGRFADLRHPEVYREPYGAYVLAWSYVTFPETVVAVIAVAALIGGRLSIRPSMALLGFTVLILLLRGTLVMQLLFPWLMRGGPLPAALSTSQFFLQDTVMAILSWLAWSRCSTPRARQTTG